MKIVKPSIVLVRPQLPENIGMAARAMDNCGLKKLIIVSPREIWPNKIALQSAANSKIIVNKAKVYNSLNAALSKFNYVIATSNRNRFFKNHSKLIFMIYLNLSHKPKKQLLFLVLKIQVYQMKI